MHNNHTDGVVNASINTLNPKENFIIACIISESNICSMLIHNVWLEESFIFKRVYEALEDIDFSFVQLSFCRFGIVRLSENLGMFTRFES